MQTAIANVKLGENTGSNTIEVPKPYFEQLEELEVGKYFSIDESLRQSWVSTVTRYHREHPDGKRFRVAKALSGERVVYRKS